MKELETQDELDLESGDFNVLVVGNDDDCTALDFLPPNCPTLKAHRSAPLPQRKQDSSLTLPEKVRRLTNPEMSSFKEENNNHSNVLRAAFDTYYKDFLTTIPFLTRGTSKSAPSVPLYLCAICLENHSQEDSFKVTSCSAEHSFCRESMGMYLSSLINEGTVASLKCPCYGMDGCSGVFSEDEVRSLVDDECHAKYTRFVEIKTNPNIRECPSCSKFATSGSESNPEIKCEGCGTEFCYLHNNAHTDITCQEYIRRTAKSDMWSLATIKATSRKCPKCKVPTQKNSGCNHMTCQHCKEDWCWLCGRHMGSGHYDGLSPCSGRQFGAAFPFALWNFFPCFQWLCFDFVYYFVHYCIIALIFSSFLALVSASLPFAIVCFPLTGASMLYSKSWKWELFLMPSIVMFGVLVAVTLGVINLIYLPVPICGTLLKLTANGCSCCTREVSYFPWQTEHADFDEDEMYQLWFFPCYFVKSFLPGGDDD